MLTRADIEQRLQTLSLPIQVAFATRCALRVLPLLAQKKSKQPAVSVATQVISWFKWEKDVPEAFWYWPVEDREHHLLAILTAQQVSSYFPSYGGKIANTFGYVDVISAANAANAANAVNAARAARAADAAARTADAADAAGVAANAAIASIAAITAITARATDDAARTAARAATEKVIMDDLTRIKQCSEPGELLETGLWPDEPPIFWLAYRARFNAWVTSLDAGFEVWLDWYDERVTGKSQDLSLLEKQVMIPKEIKNQGVRAINTYLVTLVSKTAIQPLNQVRAIFIGHGAAGKTSLIRALHGEEVVQGKEKMTAGIAIRPWPVAETGITAKLWDFGGQVMAHATHQFFLRERCLYVVVMEPRSEANANDEAEYWLQHIKAFGKNARVMLVANKADLKGVTLNLDLGSLREKYPNIIDFYRLSCTHYKNNYQSHFAIFRDDLIKHLKQVDTHQVYFTSAQFTVLKKIRERSPQRVFLPYAEFDALCQKHKIGQHGLSQADYLGLLDSLGEVIHFPALPRLDKFILNPRWLTWGVYRILYSEQVTEADGRVNENRVFDILSDQVIEDEYGHTLRYSASDCGHIIDAMVAFKLCYRLPNDPQQLVIPDKLPSNQPELNFDKTQADNTLVFEYRFQGFLPRHIMPTLIVSRHQDIDRNQVWQQGVVLNSHSQTARACIQVDYHYRVLHLWLQGEQRREWLAVLRDEILAILGRMTDLDYQEMLVLPPSAKREGDNLNRAIEKAPYQRLQAEAQAGNRICYSEAGHGYDLATVLGWIMTEEKQKTFVQHVHNGNVINSDHVGAVGGVGDHHTTTGTVSMNQAQQQMVDDSVTGIQDLQALLMNHQAEAKIKMQAYEELQQIRNLLETLQTATPEQKGKLQQLLSTLKDGSLGALTLVGKLQDGEKKLKWLLETAGKLAPLL